MAKTASPHSFEKALSELENIVKTMEDGQLPLEQTLAAYKRGTELLKFCQQALQDVQQQVKVLTESNTLQNYNEEDEGS
jgi:exodeoxyribonuclease VII small subunit